MPTVHNGIGTWYYGKRRVHCAKGVCGFCQGVGELESYDTTLYFVVFMVPLLSLGQKRVLEQCPHCKRHRVTSRKQWEASKARDTEKILEKLKQDPDNREAIQHALGLASGYQDEELFDKFALALADHRLDDAEIQHQLGAAYAYFARWPEAERAFRTSLAVADNPDVRRRLVLALLKQGKPSEAAPYAQFILDERIREHAGTIWLLIEGYQAQGQHAEALALMDQRDSAFPELAGHKDVLKQRQLSQRYLDSGKPIRSAYLTESKKAGYHEGNWTARIPRLIGPLVAAGLLVWYLAAAVWIGQARKIYLVNGSKKAYTVTVNGQARTLTPQAAVPMRVPEGDVSVEFGDVPVAVEPIHCRVETSFFARPFASRLFVLNPDQLAIVVREESEYSEIPRPNPPPQLLMGQPLYMFAGIDYEFAQFPATLQVKKGSTLKKTRVALAPELPAFSRVQLAGATLDLAQQTAYAERWLLFNPDDSLILSWLIGRLPAEEGLAFLKPRLEVRPLLVEWHRAYQGQMDKTHPDQDLRPQYRQLVAEMKEAPEALYLLARIEEDDLDEANRLLRRAAEATPPSAHALFALGMHALAEGRFPEAVRLQERATQAAPGNFHLEQGYHLALLAAGQYETLLQRLRGQQQDALGIPALVQQLQVYAIQGDRAKAQAAIDAALQPIQSAADNQARQRLQAQYDYYHACRQKDVPGFLKLVPQISDQSPFEPALLRGQLDQAAGLTARDGDQAAVEHALLFLAARQAGKEKLARDQWQAFLTALGKGTGTARHFGKLLAGPGPVNAQSLARHPMEPGKKRVFLAAIARRFPDTAKELLPLAHKLDFEPDATSLCLDKVLK